MSELLHPFGISVTRSAEEGLLGEVDPTDPQDAHDQQGLDIPIDANETVDPDAEVRAQAEISVSALIDTRAADMSEAIEMALARLVHRRSDRLRKGKLNSLQDLSEAYPDLFGALYDDSKHQPKGGYIERIRRLLMDASNAFTVLKFELI